jgi:predicted nucleic acid-binding protein
MSTQQSAHSEVTAHHRALPPDFSYFQSSHFSFYLKMITAIDTSVLMTIARQGERWERWAKALTKAASEGPLVVCCVVFGEFSQGYRNTETALQLLRDLNIHYDPILPATASIAYKNYLRAVPLRSLEPHMLPYHLIGAHASCQADRLAVDSVSDPSHYFGSLEFLGC